MATQPTSCDDIIVWPCGSWCYRSELQEYTHKSDDYEVLFVDSPHWLAFDENHPNDRTLEA